jgi:hypothetical protein
MGGLWDFIEGQLNPSDLSTASFWNFTVILPILTVFGIAGNIFNLAVLNLVHCDWHQQQHFTVDIKLYYTLVQLPGFGQDRPPSQQHTPISQTNLYANQNKIKKIKIYFTNKI